MLTASQVETTVHGLVSFYSSVRTPFSVSLGLPHSKNSHSKSNHSGRMDKEKTDWKIEKERLLSLNLEERRKEYRRQEYTTLGEVSTWRQECKENAKVEESEPTGGSSTSDKVSLHKGDITVLEVDAIVNAVLMFVVRGDPQREHRGAWLSSVQTLRNARLTEWRTPAALPVHQQQPLTDSQPSEWAASWPGSNALS
ncbi:unnamed protein product [Arctogadus glacialis]